MSLYGSRHRSAQPCDECTDIAPKTFQYNDEKLAVVVDPKGSSFKDIVKAAEKCTAGCPASGDSVEFK